MGFAGSNNHSGRGFHKAKTLETAIVRLDLLRSAVRDAYRRRIINSGTYKAWAKMNNEIGQDLGGWYNQDKKSKESAKNRQISHKSIISPNV